MSTNLSGQSRAGVVVVGGGTAAMSRPGTNRRDAQYELKRQRFLERQRRKKAWGKPSSPAPILYEDFAPLPGNAVSLTTARSTTQTTSRGASTGASPRNNALSSFLASHSQHSQQLQHAQQQPSPAPSSTQFSAQYHHQQQHAQPSTGHTGGGAPPSREFLTTAQLFDRYGGPQPMQQSKQEAAQNVYVHRPPPYTAGSAFATIYESDCGSRGATPMAPGGAGGGGGGWLGGGAGGHQHQRAAQSTAGTHSHGLSVGPHQQQYMAARSRAVATTPDSAASYNNNSGRGWSSSNNATRGSAAQHSQYQQQQQWQQRQQQRQHPGTGHSQPSRQGTAQSYHPQQQQQHHYQRQSYNSNAGHTPYYHPQQQQQQQQPHSAQCRPYDRGAGPLQSTPAMMGLASRSSSNGGGGAAATQWAHHHHQQQQHKPQQQGGQGQQPYQATAPVVSSRKVSVVPLAPPGGYSQFKLI